MRAAVCALLLCLAAGPASAAPITMNFSASGFGISNGNAAPTDPVVGSIIWDAASATSPINTLQSVDLTINGHVYQLNDVAFSAFGGGTFLIGGVLNSSAVSTLTNDFWIRFNVLSGAPIDLVYASSLLSGIWQTQAFRDFSITAAPAAVPEPATLILMLTGGAGLLARRRRVQ